MTDRSEPISGVTRRRRTLRAPVSLSQPKPAYASVLNALNQGNHGLQNRNTTTRTTTGVVG